MINCKNVMEVIAERKLKELLREYDGCKCAKCQSDMLALALNQLPVKYVNTDRGELLTQLDFMARQYSTDLVVVLMECIAKVMGSPRHEQET